MTGPAVPPGGEELQREIAQALHDADPRGWMYLAGVVLALPAVRDALAAQEKLRWVEAVAEELQGTAEITGGKVNGFVFAARLRDLLGSIGEEA